MMLTCHPTRRRARYIRTLLRGLLVATVSACRGAEGGGAGEPVVIDGVRTVTNSSAALEAAPTITLVEELRLGSVDGPLETQFGRIGAIDEGSDGSVLVFQSTDAANRSIRVFDHGGRFLRSIGRGGSGPGEFEGLGSMAIAGDTIVVLERRMHVFHAQGQPLLTTPYPTARRPNIWGLQRNPVGWTVPLLVSAHGEGRGGKSFRDTMEFRVLDLAKGAFGPPFLRLSRAEQYLLGQMGFIVSPLFAPEPQFAFSENGTVVATIDDTYRLDYFDTTGRIVQRALGETTRIPVKDGDLEAFVRSELAPYPAAALKNPEGELVMVIEMYRNDYPKLPRAKLRPVLGRVFVAPGGRVLVERIDRDPAPFDTTVRATHWDLLDPSGRIAGRMTLPPRTVPRRLRDSSLYVITRDDDDVPYVVRYRLPPTPKR
jgi:hypothetical protein